MLAYQARRPRGVSLVAGHGYSSSKHNLDFLCGFLASHGFDVFSLDFPGHKLGASGGSLDASTDLVEAMQAVAQFARTQQDAPVYAMGHSMGAMTALRVAATDSLIAGVIAIATGYGRPSALTALAGKASTDFRSSYVDGLSLPELLEDSDRSLDAALPALAGRPKLFIAAQADMMVNLASVRELYDRAPEPKSLEIIQSDHTYAAENSRSAVLQWLNALHPRT
ncbi:MAG: lysophospholipase [Candidatus Eremiobacteraeota bacterium]|nr:lysophospholipase [Candidatus Eremiobacteraeota bacterium]